MVKLILILSHIFFNLASKHSQKPFPTNFLFPHTDYVDVIMTNITQHFVSKLFQTNNQITVLDIKI
jgi:hypothetical protein